MRKIKKNLSATELTARADSTIGRALEAIEQASGDYLKAADQEYATEQGLDAAAELARKRADDLNAEATTAFRRAVRNEEKAEELAALLGAF